MATEFTGMHVVRIDGTLLRSTATELEAYELYEAEATKVFTENKTVGLFLYVHGKLKDYIIQHQRLH